ncbi:hypothetical protein [Streptomyces sp. BE133]|uniref:hypothetical protein n=1 Tax=Streptomyces sp. BE133 TaxID=3002523 RepID=UPI002E79AFBC|nr:hypothetical protein [Streptomyces sp. BE133]MEE1812946.1 hypothetical protein [Streptomyces sp. BE133]
MDGMPNVLDHPASLTQRALKFLRKHAEVIDADRGMNDAECRTRLDGVFGSHDDHVIASLRRLQDRYTGLSYQSPYWGERIFFAPVLDPDPGDERVEFLYAIHPTTASGTGASVLPDGTVMIGWGTDEVQAFPSLDHFIECDALLAAAGRFTLVEGVHGDEVDQHLSELRSQRPTLRLVEKASGHTSQWWADHQVLVHLCRTWADLWQRSQPTLQIWTAPPGWSEQPDTRL